MGSRLAAESEDLHPLAGVIGVAHRVDDQGEELVEEFAPTKYELKILAQHHAKRIYDLFEFCLAYQQGSSSETRERSWAEGRLGRVRRHLTDEEFHDTAQYIRKRERALIRIRHEVDNPPPCERCSIPRRGPIPLYAELCEVCYAAESNTA